MSDVIFSERVITIGAQSICSIAIHLSLGSGKYMLWYVHFTQSTGLAFIKIIHVYTVQSTNTTGVYVSCECKGPGLLPANNVNDP